MLIRRLHPADLDSLLSLYRHLHASDTPLPARPIVESVWAEIMSSSGHRYFGVFVDELLVSSCTLAIIPNLTRGCQPYGVIENVVTHEERRRQGHASAVLNAALQDARAAHCYKVMLLTGRKDEGTLRLYESVGFDRRTKQAFVARL